MQMIVFAGLKCAITIDTIRKEALKNEHEILFDYKKCVKIPPLSFVDNIISVSKCGGKSVQSNAAIRAKIEGMQLEQDHAKCF